MEKKINEKVVEGMPTVLYLCCEPVDLMEARLLSFIKGVGYTSGIHSSTIVQLVLLEMLYFSVVCFCTPGLVFKKKMNWAGNNSNKKRHASSSCPE